jgi:hypothetical protein
MEVLKKSNPDRGPVLINASDFDEELHTKVEGNGGKVRRMLAQDATVFEEAGGELDAAAVKELGPAKTKQEKDALDNAKVVKVGSAKRGGAPTAVGGNARPEATARALKPGEGRKLRQELAPDATASQLVPAGTLAEQQARKDPRPGAVVIKSRPRAELKERGASKSAVTSKADDEG